MENQLGHARDVYLDNPHWRRPDFERWTKACWPHLTGTPLNLTRQADSYVDPLLRCYWEAWCMHCNWLTFGESGVYEPIASASPEAGDNNF
jgi:hypothetical protein